MSAIFISHSSKDNDFSQKVKDWLNEQGHLPIDIFLDFAQESGIYAGSEWESTLFSKIQSCRAVILVCSEESMASKWCFTEVAQAIALGKTIFPLKVKECDIWSNLAKHQIIDFMKVDEEDGFARLKKGLLNEGIDAKDSFNWDASRPPYPGLYAFREADAAIFMGRRTDIDKGIGILNEVHLSQRSEMVMALGASGSGKSSVVLAGIIPRLRRDKERWLVLDPIQPRENPFLALARAFQEVLLSRDEDIDKKQIYEDLMSFDKSSRTSVMIEELLDNFKNPNRAILFTIDQFEELLNHPKDHISHRFNNFLLWLLGDSNLPVVVLGTMRSDFLGSFQQNRELSGLEFRSFLIGPILSKVELSEIIEGPAKLSGITVESKLTQALLEDVGTENYLPLLAFTLRELYDGFGEDKKLEYHEYKELGGIKEAVARAAEDILNNPPLKEQEEEGLRRAFLTMVRVDDDNRFTRKESLWADIPKEVHPILMRLVNRRLLISSDNQSGQGTLQVAHETLFRSWDRLNHWLDQDKEFLLWRNRMQRAREEWEQSNKDKNFLLQGARMYVASNWYESYEDQLVEKDKHFITESIKDGKRIQKNRRRRRIVLMTLTIMVGVVMTFLFIDARNEGLRAKANYLISEANRMIEIDPTIALRLAEKAFEIQPGDSLIRKDLYSVYVENEFYEAQFEGLNVVTSVGFSPTGDTLLVGSDDGMVRILNNKGNEISSFKLDASITSVAFSPKGNLIASGMRNGKAQLLNVNGDSIGRPIVHSLNDDFGQNIQAPTLVTFSPKGDFILSGSYEIDTMNIDYGLGIARLWDLKGNPIGKPMIHGKNKLISHVRISSFDNLLLTGSIDFEREPNIGGTARLWDFDGNSVGSPIILDSALLDLIFYHNVILTITLDGAIKMWSLEGQFMAEVITLDITDDTNSATFSPIDDVVFVGNSDEGILQAFDFAGNRIGNPRIVPGLTINPLSVSPVAVSSNGESILTGANNGHTYLWHIDRKTVDEAYFGGIIEVIDFSPNDSLIAISSSDGAGLWSFDNFLPRSKIPQKWIEAISFSPDGQSLITISSIVICKWDLKGNLKEEPLRFRELDSAGYNLGGYITKVAFTTNGERVVIGRSEGSAVVLDLNRGQIVQQVNHGHHISSVAFSPKDDLIFIGGKDGTARLWDFNGFPVGQTMRHKGEIESVAFSPKNDMLLTVTKEADSYNEFIQLWDLKGNPVSKPVNMGYSFGFFTFSPKGDLIVAGGRNGTISFFGLNGLPMGKPLHFFSGLTYRDEVGSSSISTISFSPEGNLMLSGDHDGIVRLWKFQAPNSMMDLEHVATFSEVLKQKYDLN